VLGDLTTTLKDISDTISVFSPKPSLHYLNITMRNLVKVFHKDTIPENDSGVGRGGVGGNGRVGGSQMLNEEEIIKFLKEEEMAEEE
ncbi:hypothetical protein Tco_1296395, partial [Tanacetum coccineum]